MTPREVLNELRWVQKKYENTVTPTFSINISDMARDAANAIDTLLAFTDNVFALPNCQDCKSKDCKFKPKLGETIRFNCPLYDSNPDAAKIKCPDNIPKNGDHSLVHLINDSMATFNKIKFNIPTKSESQTYPDLYKMAYCDSLTGCYNRNMLEKMRTELDNEACVVTIIDLDNLKQYNTDYGHIGGDRRLKEVAEKLQGSFQRTFRLGGDEFMVITDKPFDVENILNNIGGLSYGIYWKNILEFLSSAMHKADLLMYEAKRKKKKTEDK